MPGVKLVAWWSILLVLLVATNAAAQGAGTQSFQISGRDSDGATYQGTLELSGDHVRRRVRVGQRWVTHAGTGALSQQDGWLQLDAQVSPSGAGLGMASALGEAAPAPRETARLSVRVWTAEGRVEARLEADGYTADDQGQSAASEAEQGRLHDLEREVRSDLPAHARLHLSIEVDSSGNRLEEDALLRHDQSGSEATRTWERLRLNGDELNVAGITERLRVGASWQAGWELLDRSGGERRVRKRLESSQVARSLQSNIPARVFFAPQPVRVGEEWTIATQALQTAYKIDRLDPASSRARGRLVAVEPGADGPRYQVEIQLDLAPESIQGIALEPGARFQVSHTLTQSRTRHEIVSAGRLTGVTSKGQKLDERLKNRFRVLSLGE